MKKKVELLAPGGDVDAIKAAIVAGADAVYCGLDKFNARNRAANISFENLLGILPLAHANACEVFLTLNIVFTDSEIPALIKLLNRLVNTTINGVIVQDLGLLYLLNKHFPTLNIHASTQLTTHNTGQINFLNTLKVSRVNLSRELNLFEIKSLTQYCHHKAMLTEVFVHGSHCISFSGLCYMSSVQSGNSGNRGRCSQPCRDQYQRTEAGMDFPLNLKDNSAFYDAADLLAAGVDSLKIEGRIKKYDYVYTVVNTWRKLLDALYQHGVSSQNNADLYKVFNRNFSNGFLKGNIGKDLFIDSPRDYSIKHLHELAKPHDASILEAQELNLYKEKEAMKLAVEALINPLSIEKERIVLHVSGAVGTPLKITLASKHKTFTVSSNVLLSDKGTESIDYAAIYKRLKVLNDGAFLLEKINVNALSPAVYMPFKELSAMKRKMLFILNDAQETVPPVSLPALRHTMHPEKEKLALIISNLADLNFCTDTEAVVFFKMPQCIEKQWNELLAVFERNADLIPWFPAVLIADDYQRALQFINEVKPKKLVANNTGIAHYAYQNNIDCIAGLELNLCNSYSLLCLKELLHCSGAFISNELSEQQIKSIKKPEAFDLYYSIYHPITLMTSRQCLFQQVSSCEKLVMDASCISACKKTAKLTNLKGDTFIVEKSVGNFNRLFSDRHFLNTAIVGSIQNKFTAFAVDLSTVQNITNPGLNHAALIQCFYNLIENKKNAASELAQQIHATSSQQYQKGI